MMKIYKRTIVFALALVVVSLFGACQNKPGPQKTADRSSAPDFTLRDTSGSDVKLSNYRGKIVLLEFWASWCPPCKATIPELISMQNKYRDKGFEVIGISLDYEDNPPSKVSKFSEEHGINYKVLIGDDAVQKLYHVSSIPQAFLIDRNGRIVQSYSGYVEKMESLIGDEIGKIQ